MKNWKAALVAPDTSIRHVIETIDKSGLQIALVADASLKLLGTVTDGDVRRGILKGVRLDDRADAIMRSQPVVSRTHEDREDVIRVMRQRQIRQLPIVDEANRLVGLEILGEMMTIEDRPNTVVLMAGGLGTRLRPLTENTPKPLLRVGNKPILETIVENFVQYGLKHFYMSVNYKDQMLREYFGDGSRWGANIHYLHEETKLGTAGCLGLIPERPKHPIIVMNGDLLTKVNFQQLLDFHAEHRAQATLCIREYDFQVPYGVVKIDKHTVQGIDEKPVHKFFVNAGIYVLEPEVLSHVRAGHALDMPHLLETLVEAGNEVAAFPIREYWLDIGRLDDLERANGEFAKVFEQ